MIKLGCGLAARGLKVDFVVAGKLEGTALAGISRDVCLIPLTRSRMPWWSLWRAFSNPPGAAETSHRVPLPIVPTGSLQYLPALTRYLKRERPDVLIAGGTFYNLVALWARRLAGTPTRILVTEHNSISAMINKHRGQWRRHAAQLIARDYPSAEAIVSVSHGVAADLADCTGLPRDAITVIYNPIVDNALRKQATARVDHPWFMPNMAPVILGVGRLDPQKDFLTLIHAFAQVRARRDARLVILGAETSHGQCRELRSLADRLGVADDVDLPGFAANPFSYMARAGVFVLSSSFEGLPTVLVEALACGCPVVSTNCPSGPAEILDCGRYGRLVPVGDADAMAAAIEATLDEPGDVAARQARAAEFSVNAAIDRYLELLKGLQEPFASAD